MSNTTREVYEEALRIAESEPDFERPPICECPNFENCPYMIYNINMKKRCHYHSSGGKAK